jgi:3-hydroxy-9,10-secoandrosta-1,3,5(10)-triene-9,17-dione monooxygenase
LPDDEREMLERARALIPRLAERAPAATAARRVPAETIAEYHEAGILRILQPRRFGGREGRFSLFSQIVEELTYGCASSAWVYAVLAEHQWILAQYPERAQVDVWGDDPLAVASSSLAPRAAARRVACGGSRLSGRFPFRAAATTRNGRSLAPFSARWATRTLSPTSWCRSPTPRLSTTGRSWASPAPAANR